MQLDLDRLDLKRAHAEMNGHPVTIERPFIWRETESATEINRILNDPEVFPLISLPDGQPFEVSGLLRDPRFVFLRCVGGVLVFAPDLEPTSGIYEVHINFLPEHRGREALHVVQEALRWVFTHTSAMMLWTRVPAFNKAAEAMCKAIDGRLWFSRPKCWPVKGGEPADCKFYALSIHDWMVKCKSLTEQGRWFHDRLESEYQRLGVAHEPHADEDAHDHAVGAAVEMMRGGQPGKALIIYNRWARAAGYRQMNMISENPLCIDIGEAWIHVTDRTFKVIRTCLSAQQ